MATLGSNAGAEFVTKANELLEDVEERERLFESLKRYQSSQDLDRLIQDLHSTLNDPNKMEMYEFIRPLIPPRHQLEYDKMAPSPPGRRLRLIRLKRRSGESLGFAVRGGYEHGVGVFVSHIEPGSQAYQQGLKVGDEIVRVNGFTIAEAIHEEVLNLIKAHEEIELKVTTIGMLPVKENANDSLTWKYVEKAKFASGRVGRGGTAGKEVKLFINMRGTPSLGCSIVSGPPHFPGIFVERVRPGCLAQEYGLRTGDQIIDVNGTSFLDITHEEALVALKGSKELNMVIKKGAGLPLFEIDGKSSPRQSEEEDKLIQLHALRIENERERMKSTDLESKILDEDRHAQEEQRRQEELDLERIRVHKEQELMDEELKRQEEERRQRELNEKLRQAEADRKRKEEERKRREEEDRRQKEEEERRMKEEEKRRKQEEAERQRQESEERRQRLKQDRENSERLQRETQERLDRQRQEAERLKQQSNILAGRGAPVSSKHKPALLGAGKDNFNPKKMFTAEQIGGREIKKVKIKKVEDIPLDIELEGGVGSPLGGKVVVSQVFHGGAAHSSGEIGKGDQIMMVNGKSMLNISHSQAESILWDAESSTKPDDVIEIVIGVSELKFQEDEVSRRGRLPTSNLDDLLDLNSSHQRPVAFNPITFIH